MLGISVLGVNSCVYMNCYVANIVCCDFSVFLCISYVSVGMPIMSICCGVINKKYGEKRYDNVACKKGHVWKTRIVK